MNATHSVVFQSHMGTSNCSIPNVLFSSAPNTRTFFISENACVYSPLGSRIIKCVLGAPLLARLFLADSIDHRIRPATEQDFPLPVLPRTAKCLPNNLSGSIATAAFPAMGLTPISTRRSLPDSTIDRSCACVGTRTGSPTVGNTSIPRENSYISRFFFSSIPSRSIPIGITLIFLSG